MPRIALIQARARGTRQANLDHAIARIGEAAGQGARIVCLQELFLGEYFCRRQDPALFDLAEPVPGRATEALQAAAADSGVVVIGSVFERQMEGLYFNTAFVIDADGRYLGKYRKTHIPQDPGFEEKFYFAPGDSGYCAWDTAAGRIGVCVCWDQWFPEAARQTALQGAEIIFYPTAIGWLKAEKAELGEAQHHAWETVQAGHAVANGCYIAACNRVGIEGETEFWGQSFVADPYGRVSRASIGEEAIFLYDCDLGLVREFRRIWPFFRDLRR